MALLPPPLAENPFPEKTFEERCLESAGLLSRYQDRVPVIMERTNPALPLLDKNRFIVPKDMTIGQFVFVLRHRLSLPADQALFIFTGTSLPSSTMLIRECYNASRSPDGFLRFSYSSEAAFG
jgi:GABA(A) receptor-associated protein